VLPLIATNTDPFSMDADSDSVDTSYGSLPPLIPRAEFDSDSDEEWDWDNGRPPLEPVDPFNPFEWGLENIPALDVIEQIFRRNHDETEKEPPPFLCNPFHQFPLLHEDLQTHILSFVAECPFENPKQQSPVMHVLPFVSQRFRAMCQSDYFWQLGLERLVAKDPTLWVEGLQKLHQCDASSPHFVRLVREALGEPGYLRLFRSVVDGYIRVTFPFHMIGGQLRLNSTHSSLFSEERHKRLIQEVMEGYPETTREGRPIVAHNGKVPSFVVYAHRSRRAFIAEIRECHIRNDGSASVLFSTVADVRITRLWEDDNTLLFAECFRMSSDESNSLNGARSLHRILDDLDASFLFAFMAARLPRHRFNFNIFQRAPPIVAELAGDGDEEGSDEDEGDGMSAAVGGDQDEVHRS
jgi:hypothetical protein